MNTKSNQIIQGGFSEPILQPIYVVTVGTILLLNPYIGLFWASIIVAIPSFLVATKISNKHSEALNTLRKLVVDQYNLNINVSDLDYSLRYNDYQISTSLLKEELGISYNEAKKLKDILIEAGIATQKTKVIINTLLINDRVLGK